MFKIRIFVSGANGFVFSNLMRLLVNKYPQHNFINYDLETYAGKGNNLKDIENKENYEFVKGDICDFNLLCHILKDVDVVIHSAAESHVDNSIGESLVFTKSNTLGTHTILEACKVCKVKKIIHISTDEIYGEIEEGSNKEEDKLNPSNPYSASKAAGEMIANGYIHSFKLPIIMVRPNNNYGPYQFPEKLMAKTIVNALQNKKIPVHGDGSYIRSFIYVEDCCEAIELIFRKGKIGEIYNIGTNDEIRNIDLIKKILMKLGKQESLIECVKDRPFNDKRYSVNIDKLKALGWKQKTSFEEGLDKTIEWYKNNEEWWEKLK